MSCCQLLASYIDYVNACNPQVLGGTQSTFIFSQLESSQYLLENMYLLRVNYLHLGCKTSICRVFEVSNLMVLHSIMSFHSYSKKGELGAYTAK
ncbi:MAG: hypothetical protein EZS28_038907 [Streblomastix strix]|uniref:Uncharacterized protein n=1 Tax=Streblomastix strix TaxID=222440 RepID=A0A5J4U5K0_9EUKA|nr:MAG: hypothetical protein EZS28_038907 [Streblomastix strix]